jgi:hypothetical protein
MRIAILVYSILALILLALIGLSYTPGFAANVSVTGTDNGVIIQNIGNHPCLVIVNSLEGEQQFELAVGANVTLATLSNITGTIILALGSRTVPVDLEWLEKTQKPIGWPGFNDKLSSNFTELANGILELGCILSYFRKAA